MTLLLLLILALGVSGAHHVVSGQDDYYFGELALRALRLEFGVCAADECNAALIRAASIVGVAAWVFLLVVMCREKWAAWQGVMVFAASWLIFPLFQVINQGFPALHHYDDVLLGLDRALWGGSSLPEHVMALENIWLSEVVSLAYLCFYFIVLLPVIWAAWRRKSCEAQCFLLGLNTMFLFGYLGYLCVPAGGPFMAFPAIFPYPPAGGAITHFLSRLVAQGVTGMDVFPSLHCGVTLYVLGFFALGWKQGALYRAATRLLILIGVPLVLATVYLRYHYGVDLLAGLALAFIVHAWLYHQRYPQERHHEH
jgi:hypothetical protein